MCSFNDIIICMKQVTKQLKNVTSPKETFSKFLDNFNTLKKLDKTFYSWDERRVDYNVVRDAAEKKGIKHIPTQEELNNLIH